ncbi:MAG: 30S ribosomal protein S20 [Syntrophomonadaceae bacterium]|nr:30S ribosomal protein S20 [Syntrophomonadaceae bacterium]
MAKGKTPAKRARQAEENRLRNKVYKTRLKNMQNNYEAALNENDMEKAQESLLQLTSTIDKSVSKGIIHKNKAARKKSTYTKQFNALSK